MTKDEKPELGINQTCCNKASLSYMQYTWGPQHANKETSGDRISLVFVANLSEDTCMEVYCDCIKL